jgi:hypothetical protein
MGRLAVTRTVIPLEYDRSTEGFNRWALGIRNELHLPDQNFTIQTIIPITEKVIKFHIPLNKN